MSGRLLAQFQSPFQQIAEYLLILNPVQLCHAQVQANKLNDKRSVWLILPGNFAFLLVFVLAFMLSAKCTPTRRATLALCNGSVYYIVVVTMMPSLVKTG